MKRPPRILLVTAHPDDEALFAGMTYRATRRLRAMVDLLVVTNGEAGSRYASLAAEIYGLPLTDDRRGRAVLSRIRRRELRESARLLGIRQRILLGEPNGSYSLVWPSDEPAWNTRRVVARIQAAVAQRRYDFLVVMLPVASTHREHKLSTVLALEAALRSSAARPAVLGASLHSGDPAVTDRWSEGFPILPRRAKFRGLDGVPSTNLARGAPVFSFPLDTPIEPGSSLTHRIVHNWVVAAHRTQGKMQLRMNAADEERYWCFAMNSPRHIARCVDLFRALNPDRM
jgi:LmbE family N-acetylglucosaminyl deacetylase